MRRGAKPTKPKVEAKPRVARKSRKNEGSRVRDLEKRLAESLEREKATSEILRVISESQTDVQPVFDTIIQSAVRLVGGFSGVIAQIVGDQLHLAALTSTNPSGDAAQKALWPKSVKEDTSLHGQVIAALGPRFITDVESDRSVPPIEVAVARARGYRSIIGVPLLRDGRAVGSMTVTRRAPGPFADGQVALLQTFANQAVIAIENARLFNETKEALDQQTATSEILSVISSSPTNIEPVFHAIVDSAVTLCGAALGYVVRVERDLVHVVAHRNYPPEAMAAAYPTPLSSANAPCRAIRDNAVIHVPDSEALDAGISPEGLRLARASGVRSYLAVPMRRQGPGLGAILVARRDPGPFSDKQIALLQTFAHQAVIAIENVRLFKELEVRNRDLTTTLEQQTATSEILRVISSSPTDLQPVFDTIVASAVRLCSAHIGAVYQFDGEMLHLAAHYNFTTESLEALRSLHPRPPQRDLVSGRAILERAVVQIEDVRADPQYLQDVAHVSGWRSMVAVPMLREGVPTGAIVINRDEPGPFTDAHVELLQTFADQAVIAIENVRLFKELQASNRDLTEALEQQTATSEILKVISSSPTDVQPVFDAIAESAARLCGAFDAVVYRVDGNVLRPVAHHGSFGAVGPLPLVPGTANGRAAIERRLVHVADLQAAIDEFPEGAAISRQEGTRSFVSVPLLRTGGAIGTIAVRRFEIRPFTDDQIALLKTFADQAVIAIENVRLFTELQEKNRALMEAHTQVTEALERQTATAEILRVISSSPTDVQPVFDIIAQRAVSLCDAEVSVISQFDGTWLQLVALHGMTREGVEAMQKVFPMRLDAETVSARVFRSRTVVHIQDVLADPSYDLKDTSRAGGWRCSLAVPLLREGQVIGVIFVGRSTLRLFSDSQVELLKTLADQAVIAIENVRLFAELQARTSALIRSVAELQALGEVSRAVSQTLDLDTVLATIASRAVQLSATDAGTIWEYDETAEEFRLRAAPNLEDEIVAVLRGTQLRRGEGTVGRLADTHAPIQVADISGDPAYRGRLDVMVRSGYRAILSLPLLREDQLIGALTVNAKTPREFPPAVVDLLTTFATQSALAIQNARLFREIEDKSRQLEVASQHKSEFLANMSHELRTPLNAIIGFSEVLTERMFGELNEKQDEYLKDIYASGQHLLSLINDILDLSKIEAGRMELEPADFDLPSAIDNALTLVRERAGRRGITLGQTIDERVGMIRGDERKVKQVLLNLLSNALKFTPEGGRIDVRAAVNGELVEVSVADTGVGIAPEDQEAVFEEFRQVGTADKKVEGTGLGLTLSRKFIELHGGRIWVKSQVGQGSTFTFTLPVSRGE